MKYAGSTHIILLCEALALLLGQSNLEALDKLYRFYDDKEYNSIASQLIPLEVLFKNRKGLGIPIPEASNYLPCPISPATKVEPRKLDYLR